MRRAAATVGVGGILLAVYACRTPTEVRLDITTEIPCSQLKGLSIVVAADSVAAEERAKSGFYAADGLHCDSETSVGSIVVTPGDASLAVIVIVGVEKPSSSCTPPLYAGCVVARRRLAFVEHASLHAPIAVTRSCVDVPCDTTNSCSQAKCTSSDTQCEGDSCVQTGTDAAEDAGLDAGGDGPVTDTGTPGLDASPKDGGIVDAGFDGGVYDGGTIKCASSPGCPPDGQPPCSCSGQIMPASNGATMMVMTCAAGADTCACTVGGQFYKAIPSSGSCQPGDYGRCCAP